MVQVRTVEEQFGVWRKDAPGATQVRRKLRQIPCTKKVRRYRAVPKECVGVGTWRRHDAVEKLAPDVPMRRSLPPAFSASVLDERIAVEIPWHEDPDIGMESRAASEHIVRSQRLVTVKAPLKVIQCESPIVNEQDRLVTLDACSASALPTFVLRPLQKRHELSDVAQQRCELA